MKNVYLPAIILSVLMFFSCSQEKPFKKIVDDSLDFSLKQYGLMTDVMKSMPGQLPRTIDSEGKLITESSSWWTSGFYPGSLWYLYEYSNDPGLKGNAVEMSMRVEKEKYTTDNHDVGFILYCSFGNGLRLTGEESYNEILMTGARSLCTRFRPVTGCIQSWEATDRWQCPVIVDNLMNLELLMWAFRHSRDSSFYRIATSHADVTMKNHYRPDHSAYHVVSYDTVTGQVQVKATAQGAATESVWARGQSWGLYGYTMMYRETGLKRYLDHAVNIADFLINHPNLPSDKIPYWDYLAPEIPNARRDASSAAIMASALIELGGIVGGEKGDQYMKIAEIQIRSLSSPAYRAKLGENGNFILMHSVGSIPHNSEIDVPLTYADYYFIEALLRYRKILKQS
ncbi:MAG TPA: glycoside hydrolase family 88 protein [Bacteroidales bacterium]|nr:glucuronyl hydrolase [Bacteroidales bacterium]HNR43240.1 glycoside hydrolase family 88 protein [Bacteroidales bacterium]HQG76659.1 glycoside hydrolase family 88 protein [Bacteroidales bacterium]